MNRETVIQLAREAGFNTNHEMVWIKGWEISPYMQRFASAVEQRTLERAAVVCETYAKHKLQEEMPIAYVYGARDCAAAIRALKDTP